MDGTSLSLGRYIHHIQPRLDMGQHSDELRHQYVPPRPSWLGSPLTITFHSLRYRSNILRLSHLEALAALLHAVHYHAFCRVTVRLRYRDRCPCEYTSRPCGIPLFEPFNLP